jgi:hypothetical protein
MINMPLSLCRRPCNNFRVQQVTLLLLLSLFITITINIIPILSWTGNIKSLSKPQTTLVTWLIDGTNLACSRSVPNQREQIIHEIQKIASSEEIILHDEDDSSNHRNNDDGPKATYTDIDTDTINNTRKTTSATTTTITNVVLIFDGNEDENFTDTDDTDNSVSSKGKAKILLDKKWFKCIITDGTNKRKDRADDYIVDYIIPSLLKLEKEEIIPLSTTETSAISTSIATKVHLVTADKELQKRVRATRIMKSGSCIHPPKFWKEYIPVLQQQQQQQQAQQQQQQVQQQQEQHQE